MQKRNKIGVIVFPGSNCDHDAVSVINSFQNTEAVMLWHKERNLQNCDAIILPGGFSYGDYLRTGAIAKFSPVMEEVFRFSNEGRPVIGICNGFQILTEAGLLDGALMRNASRRFVCRFVHLKVVTQNCFVTAQYQKDEIIKIPIAHGEGNFFASEDTLKSLQDEDRILFQYCDLNGIVGDHANPNGSLLNIAGITNKQRNVVGLMPHPERAAEPRLGSTGGKKFFQSLLQSLEPILI
ncbi:MAG: phosphoribosylformylglycinamidine synthase subunit PurQ [Chloroherpetonaceae bacterium]|nr:phosphoribosylformylglycinamidine synthase subunit PurQ [Chloroherpetonaceae bacterium]